MVKVFFWLPPLICFAFNPRAEWDAVIKQWSNSEMFGYLSEKKTVDLRLVPMTYFADPLWKRITEPLAKYIVGQVLRLDMPGLLGVCQRLGGAVSVFCGLQKHTRI